jgi:bifunctional UDP-N-acetylglucosamine pyrophosphorylase/glucosamine-1-phosphate N-acetyltransferase
MEFQVVILAGGESSRFFPFNDIHKSFFRLAGKTILERTIESIKKLKPKEILLVLGSKNFEREKEICDSNPTFEGVRFIRETSPLGQADAILSAKEFIKGDFFVVNANQFNFHTIADEFIKRHKQSGDMVTLGITKTEMPFKYGVVELDKDRIRGIVEKPKAGSEPSNMRLVGIYLFSENFLVELVKTPPSDCSLEETLDIAAKNGKVGAVTLTLNTPSLKYPWDLFDLKDFIFSEMHYGIDRSAIIEKTAILKGRDIYVGKNAHIYDFAIIEGPAYIGEGAVVGAYCQVRGKSVLGSGSQIERYCDVKNTIIGDDTHFHSGFVADSVIGKDCRIGAEFITANKRLDRSTIRVIVKEKETDTGRDSVGIFIGDEVKVGIRVSSMPGAVVGPESNVYPGVTIKGHNKKGSLVKN